MGTRLCRVVSSVGIHAGDLQHQYPRADGGKHYFNKCSVRETHRPWVLTLEEINGWRWFLEPGPLPKSPSGHGVGTPWKQLAYHIGHP